MNQIKYELHDNLDPEFPLIFGYRALSANENNDVYLHWHDGIELIYCSSGEGWVLSGTNRIAIQEGDLIIVNSGNIHDLFSDSNCGVYSLNPGGALFAPFRLEPHKILLQEKINDENITNAFKRIISEMNSKKDNYYRQAVHIEIVSLVLTLMREYSVCESNSAQSNEDRRNLMIKQTICYLREHFLEPVAILDICAHIGYSKFYLCRSFKEITGFTITQYINRLKCQYARNLLLSGQYNVNESAELSGFCNHSYFSKIYKSISGILPSEEYRKAQKNLGVEIGKEKT